MFLRAQFIQVLIVTALLLHTSETVLARGGSGGGGGGAGFRGGGGGGYRGGGGYAGRGPGYHGYTGGYAGYRGYGYRGINGPGRYYGWGYPGYYGWGYPYFGYGLGLGIGYGLASGYAYPYASGYPYYAYGDPYYGSGNTTYANPASYNPNTSTAAPAAAVTQVAAPAPMANAIGREFVERGDTDFKTSNYDAAAYAYRHAIVDDPRNNLLLLKLAQTLFAIGKYEEAAGATQAAMRQLPKEDWGRVVSQYQQVYGNAEDYTQQLRSLESAISKKPNDPALRFLAGYHYGYLGFLKQSIDQLDKAIQIESRDEMAKLLKEEMNSKLSAQRNPASLAPLPLPPAPAPDQ